MKRLLAVGATILALAGVLVAASPAQALPPPRCLGTQYHPVMADNGLVYSQSARYWHGPVHRSGNCGHVWVRYFDMLSTPDGQDWVQFKIQTYNDNGTSRYVSPWTGCKKPEGPDFDLRPNIDDNRLFRYYVRACAGGYNSAWYVPGFIVWAGDRV